MDEPRAAWRTTTHDWASTVDLDHLARIRRDPAVFAPGGLPHLILEVVAYAADEAECNGGGHCRITLHDDGSVTVTDDGRGTDTRLDEHGEFVKKPVIATEDVRFFDRADAPLLPDGHHRRGMSTLAALSTWLVHTNRRSNGSWTQRYEHGVPSTDLQPVPDDGTTGTSVRFLPDRSLLIAGRATRHHLAQLTASWPHLSVDVDDHRTT
ncbi:ATP-binding protein [Streptomyces kunmingensis]|uniref:DNA topoisomerase (ATP-hydrolyzing) n=1 Tax=Streptomyces kunmingensis TaxID=68225 RepID=A0ABU6CI77_9ACTN|nr:ATP-binding protein [Streptomyces kunmingensis]MEB3964418.1 ATP-binding protein [Streptomyces kunmingensis]